MTIVKCVCHDLIENELPLLWATIIYNYVYMYEAFNITVYDYFLVETKAKLP